MNKKWWIEIVFWIHLPIVILWFGLFAIPLSLWPSRITFHFWFIISIMVVQYLWGFSIYPQTKKIDNICPLTSLMQFLRGYPLNNKKNYEHSFIAELFERLNIRISYKAVSYLLLITLAIVAIQYFFSNYSE